MSLVKNGFEIIKPTDASLGDLIAKAAVEQQGFNSIQKGLRNKWTSKSKHVKQTVDVHRVSNTFKEIIFSKPVTSIIAEAFSNQPCYVNHSKISYKNVGTQVWLAHQDGAYKADKDAFGLTVCVFLEDVESDQGPIVCLKGSHLDGIVDHEIAFSNDETEPQIKIKNQNTYDAVPIIGKAGTILVMDFKTIHFSLSNKTSSNRPIFIFEVEKITEHPLEFDGRDALTFFYVPDSIVVLPRLKNFVRNVIVFPVLKKIIYATHKIGFFRA